MDWEALLNEFEQDVVSRRWGAAIAICTRALSTSRLPRALRVDWLIRKARVHWNAAPGATGPAIAALKEARFVAAGDPGALAKVIVATLIVHRYGGQDPHLAAELLDDLTILRSNRHSDEVEKQAGPAYFNAGQLFEEVGRLDEAEYAYAAAIQAFQGRSEPEVAERLAWAQDHLAGIYLQTDRVEAGRQLVEQAHAVLNDGRYGPYTYKRRAEVALAAGQLDQADQLVELALGHSLADDRAKADALLVRVRIAEARGDWEAGERWADAMADAAIKAGYTQVLEVYYDRMRPGRGE